jgi:hypothetical protein
MHHPFFTGHLPATCRPVVVARAAANNVTSVFSGPYSRSNKVFP